jgi:nitroreductase
MLEGGQISKMETIELMKHRRSIRKYQDRQISREDLETIMEAGIFAPNAGGGQRSRIVGIHNKELCEQIGRLNASCMDRSNLAGKFVSKDQPSIIDDVNIKSGFYGAPTVCAIFAPVRFLYSVADCFCAAENMVLAAAELGISSCIVARGEETFNNEFGGQLLAKWNIPEGYVARCFVLLGYCDGEYPKEKPRKEGRTMIWE